MFVVVKCIRWCCTHQSISCSSLRSIVAAPDRPKSNMAERLYLLLSGQYNNTITSYMNTGQSWCHDTSTNTVKVSLNINLKKIVIVSQ